MAFKSVDEVEQFRFDDCQISAFTVTDQKLELEVEALIVRTNNSQNTNYTESYAGTTKISLVNGTIQKIIKDGYRYYDANDVLLSEVPDEELSEEEIKQFPGRCRDAYLYDMQKTAEGYILGIEFEDPDDHGVSDSYQVIVACDSVICTWERYMNRVQN